jgi:hypothetical protein
MSMIAERYNVSVRGYGEDQTVEYGLPWREARQWCQDFNEMMSGTGVVAVPHESTPLLRNPLGEVRVNLGVDLSGRNVGMS